MPLALILTKFNSDVAQCESLIGNAHTLNANGVAILSAVDRQQITVAAFLNMFIAWEEFLENAIAEYMIGEPGIGGVAPIRFASPVDTKAAKAMAIGMMKHFDYANQENLLKLSKLYFHDGLPVAPVTSALLSDLLDLKIIRNSCAHMSSTTNASLETLAGRVFGQPQPGITVYTLLTAIHPQFTPDSVFVAYKNKLSAAASLIAHG